MSRSIPPSVTFPSPNEWPITYVAITGITQGLNALVTAPDHGITVSSDASTPKVDFSQVNGMKEINGQFAFVVSVIDVNRFTVALDTSNYSAYVSGGFINKTGGSSPIDPLTNLYP